MVFPAVMYRSESWALKKAECQRIIVFKFLCKSRLLRVPWTARRSNQSILKEIYQPWIFIGRTDAEIEAPILWPPNAKSQLIGKDPDAGKEWRQEEQGTTEDQMIGWHHLLNGHELEQTWKQWRMGKPGKLQTVGSQRVGNDLATEQQFQVKTQVHKPVNPQPLSRSRLKPQSSC